MTAWFKQKSKIAALAAPSKDITRAIHTMHDDLEGRAPVEPVAEDPLVTFQPEAAPVSVPFFAAAETTPLESEQSSEGQAVPEITSASPFLGDQSAFSAEKPSNAVESTPQTVVPSVSPQVDGIGKTSSPPEKLPVTDVVPPSSENQVLSSEVTSATEALSQSTQQPEATPVVVNTEAEVQPVSPRALLKNLLLTYRWWLMGIGVAIIALLLTWFGWRWYQAKQAANQTVSETTSVPEPNPTPAPTPEPTPVEPVTPHYLTNQPNLLSLDTETITTDAIKAQLLQIALSIQNDNLHQPVEFLIRDQKLNPLAFSRFAYLLQLGLPTDLVAALDEDFSLYFVMDQVRPRVGLKVKIKSSEAFTSALQASEATLPAALEPIFLDTTTAPKTNLAFRSGLYHDQPVRFVNVDSALGLSVDYAVHEGLWFVGTSQNTLRALLDATQSATTTPSTSSLVPPQPEENRK